MKYMNDVEQDIAFFYGENDVEYPELENDVIALDHVYTAAEVTALPWGSYGWETEGNDAVYPVTDVIAFMKLYIDFAADDGKSPVFSAHASMGEHDKMGVLEMEPIIIHGTEYQFPRIVLDGVDLVYLLRKMGLPIPAYFTQWDE